MQIFLGLRTLLATVLRFFAKFIGRGALAFTERPAIFLYRKFLGLHFRLIDLGTPLKNPVLYALSSRSLGYAVTIGITVCVVAINISLFESENEITAPNNIISHYVISEEDRMFMEETDTSLAAIDDGAGLTGLTAPMTGPSEEEDFIPAVTPGSISLSSGAIIKPVIPDTEERTTSPDTPRTYVVQAGDTLGGIAHRFGLKTSTILWANGLTSKSTLREGAKLTILPTDGVLYTVKRGDSVGKIASAFGADSDAITSYNQLKNGTVRIGATILIPGGIPTSTTAVAAKPTIAARITNILRPPADARNIPSVISKAIGMVWPTTATRITQYYSWRHTGVDIAGPVSNKIVAADSGKVVISGWQNGYGNTVVIDHGKGVRTRYGHASKLYVSVGESVAKGQTIAMVGSTGRSTGPHLHFEVLVSGKRVNPLSYVRK